jgi:colanic acid/amylovoran biosynthesis protein
MTMRVAISHWHGPNNLGDLAILRAQYSLLKDADPDIQIHLVAVDSQSAQAAAAIADMSFESILILPWQGLYAGRLRWMLGAARAVLALVDPDRLSFGTDMKVLRDLMRSVTAVMPKGGGYLYALDGARGVLFAARITWPLLFARRLGVRRILWGHSIGPCKSWLGSLIFKAALKGAAITVRDRASLALLTKWGMPARILPDLAFHLVAEEPNAYQGRRSVAIRRIGLTAREMGRGQSEQHAYEHRLRVSLNELVAKIRLDERTEVEVVGIVQVSDPTTPTNDRHVLERILSGIDATTRLATPGDGGIPTVSQLLEAYAELDLLVATRMHSAILSGCVARPFVVIEYIGGKARGIVDALGLPDWVYLTDLTDLSSVVIRAWQERAELEARIRVHGLEARASLQQLFSDLRAAAASGPGVTGRVAVASFQ